MLDDKLINFDAKNSPINHDLSHVDAPLEVAPVKRRSPYHYIFWGVIGSLLVHLGFIIASALMPAPAGFTPDDTPMRTHIVRPHQNPPAEDQKQVVSVAKPKDEQQRPKDPEYLAEYNRQVKEQTKSRVTDPHAARVTDRPMPQSAGRAQEQPSKSSQKKEESKEVRTSTNGLLAKKDDKPDSPKSALMPTWKDAGFEGGAPSNDYLRNVQEDTETKLNTAEWNHAPFFNRVKQAISRRWNPNRAIKRNDPQGTTLGHKQRFTQVLASIDREGKLVAIKVLRESGSYFLDDEAMRAFKEAAPFSNPPKALFARRDTFEFPFGFMLTYDKGFKFDLDWRPN